MLDDINVYEHVDQNAGPTGTLTLNVSFADAPARFYIGAIGVNATREQVVQMLRELAIHIEYDITGAAH